IIIASRPEPDIREIFEESLFHGLYEVTNIEKSFEDVRIYLLGEFSRIHREHRGTMGNIPIPWPSATHLDTLVERSSGDFIYAATVIKFIDDGDFRPTERLLTILQNVTTDSSDPSNRPFEALDQLYLYILRSSPARSRFLPISCVILQVRLTLSLADIEQLVELNAGDVGLALRRLHSVLQVPSVDSRNISVYHASFLDFQGDPNRSDEF
ncbi:hypothetical protein B0H13DRAFT_1471315, partial [Mycena leptocephala]